jgi:glucose-1-phosphate cytidylyltransferase
VKTVILAGGLGTRLEEETGRLPKPMVEVGGHPLLWHIMKHFSHHGLREFYVALGYKGDVVKRYFLHYHALSGDFTIDVANGAVRAHGSASDDWRVHLMDTGQSTNTGGRVLRLREHVGGEAFMLTYGDGVSDVDLHKVIAFHKRHGRIATLTAVRPPARFGSIGNFSTLRRRSPRPWPWPHDIICQTRTLAPPRADATEHMSGLLAGRANRPG